MEIKPYKINVQPYLFFDDSYFSHLIYQKNYQNIMSVNENPRLLLHLTIFLVSVALSSQTCAYNPNHREILDTIPTLVAKVENGERYLIGDRTDVEGNFIHLLKVKGTPYEMGKAYGKLFAPELKQNLQTFFDYYVVMLQENISKQKRTPSFIKKIMEKNARQGLYAALDLNVQITRKYSNSRYFEEMKGIADGSGVNLKMLKRFNILPEFIKAHCTVAGIWKQASLHERTLHMRALDWDASNPMNKFPLITVYHPSNPKLHKHANIAWVGFIGSLTGISPKITIGQKVWLPPQNSIKTTRFGNPWTFVLRDLLYEASNMHEAIQMLQKASRTCTIHLGVGSSQDHTFRSFQYSYRELTVFDDKNYTLPSPAIHKTLPGISYFDKHAQPSSDTCVGQLLTNSSFYGQWEMESFWRIVGNSHSTGDTQLVVFDLEKQEALISYSRTREQNTISDGKNEKEQKITEKAYARSPIYVSFQRLWTQF